MNQPFPVPFESRAVVLPADNVDTDQIIPARFLTSTVRTGLGKHLFADWRFDEAGLPRSDFPLNHPSAQGAHVLVAGTNFGCGSSREHAPWALTDFGFRAVIAPSFADIFQANALKNGLAPIRIDAGTHQRLTALLREHPSTVVIVDLREGTVRARDVEARFHLEAFAKHCLLNGVDELAFLLGHRDRIARFEALRAPRVLAEQLP
jgi:3-isopropylmalate/(R)-2-methylmalate dehydratase small subunit